MLKKPFNGPVFTTFMSVFGVHRRSLKLTSLLVSMLVVTGLAYAEPRIPSSLKDVQFSFAPVVEQERMFVLNSL